MDTEDNVEVPKPQQRWLPLESNPEVGSSKNKIEGDVTSSQAIETLRFSPPEMDRWPLAPILMSLMLKIPNSDIVSMTRNLLASKDMSRGKRRRAE